MRHYRLTFEVRTRLTVDVRAGNRGRWPRLDEVIEKGEAEARQHLRARAGDVDLGLVDVREVEE